MEKKKDLCEVFYRMECMVYIMYAGYEEKIEKEEQEKEREKNNDPSPSLGKCSSSSYSSHHSIEEINKSLQVENATLKRLLQEAKIVTSITSHGRGLGNIEVQQRLSEASITCFRIKNWGKQCWYFLSFIFTWCYFCWKPWGTHFRIGVLWRRMLEGSKRKGFFRKKFKPFPKSWRKNNDENT